MKLPAPHLVLSNLLLPEQVEQLLSYTLENEGRFEPRTVAGDVPDPDRWLCLKLNDLGPFAEMFQALIQQDYTAWTKALRLSAFALGRVELRMAAYRDKGSFDYHLDSTSDASSAEHSRMLTGVYYYHRQPQQFSGGAIRLFDLGAAPESSNYLEIAPTHNSLLLFPSWVGHQVMPIRCESGLFADARFSVNVWLHKLSKRA